ncbi:MAG: hypothetical protein C0601_04780 [Candidatus Muiribacterium halophilum]|uniref:AMP-activated protein kinase glycogen-binding domain-containing protein n=1 Tax=Muiribacterium halophilum TaxID=2053465 RepID=A0A2N5ZI59_MUIH1|nr:MAG: hypothetical protein C0601_04780 [Candidatus Muirbacterium halophilum]
MKRFLFVFISLFLIAVCSFSLEMKNIQISYYAPDANAVKVAIDIYDWDADKIVLVKNKKGIFEKNLRLPVGEYKYKFIVDGKWTLRDDLETISEDGYTNHILKVGSEEQIIKAKELKNERLIKRRALAKKYGNLSTEMYRLYDSFKFAVLGDMNNDRKLIKAAVEYINNEKVSFTLGVGDYVKRADDIEEWIDFLSVTSSLKEPFVPVLGEREYLGDKTAESIRYLMRLKDNNTFYSFDYEDKKFIITDSNQERHGSFFSNDQTNWLEKELVDTSDSGKFIIGYRPYYIKGSLPRFKDSWAKYSYERDRLHSLYRKDNVIAVISGCEDVFVYKKVDLIDYIVCPENHLMVVEVSDSLIFYRIYEVDIKKGKIIYKETIKREVR